MMCDFPFGKQIVMLSFSGPFSCSSSSPDVLSKSRYNHYSLYSQVSEWYQLIFEQQRISENPFACTIKVIQLTVKAWSYPKRMMKTIYSVGQKLFRTSNLIGSCWPEALLFQSWCSLLVLFGLGPSIVFKTNPLSCS